MSETLDTLIDAAGDFYKEFACAPTSIHVSFETYKSLCREYFSTPLYQPSANGYQKLTLNTYVGPVMVLPERDMPPNVDYYFNDDREWTWLDQLFEDVILRGKHD